MAETKTGESYEGAESMKCSKDLTAAIYAHNDLSIFAAVVGLLESGVVYSLRGKKTADKIIDICKAATHVQLRVRDAALARIEEPKS
jgi:hypothetical protein